MSPVQESLELRVLRVIEELLKDRPPDARQVFTNMVCLRMRVEAEKAIDEVAQAMSDLLADGYVRGKESRGDNKALDVAVTAITDQGLGLLWNPDTPEKDEEPTA
jgi:hypothetical protein